jgi:hypothetical protein
MKIFPEMTWHRYPKDRTFWEKVTRKFVIPPAFGRYSLEQWSNRDIRMKRVFPVRWFLGESLPQIYHTKICRRLKNVRLWFRYRLFDRYDILKLELEPGYYDPDERLLQANFQILKDFVEIELASMYDAVGEDEGSPGFFERFGSKFRQRRRKNGRDPEAGLAHLDWEIEECAGSAQAEAAKEKKAIYLWWTVDRPNRFDLYNDPHLGWKEGDRGDADYDMLHRLEDFYREQDEEMLIRLVKVRYALWT